MLIVVEGCVGSGKSTLVAALSAKLKCPVYRAFPDSQGNRGKSEDVELLKGLVDVNSWQEDIYTMDLLSQLKIDIILDRSLPSALAYNSWLEDDAFRLIKWWGKRLAPVGMILKLTVTTREAIQRNKHGFSANFIAKEIYAIDTWCALAEGEGATVCDLPLADPESVVVAAHQGIQKWRRSHGHHK